MQRLFAVYVGGTISGCHLELHDLRFAVGASIEDCYDALRAQWWGAPESLHLDAWGPIEWADGFGVSVVDSAHEAAGHMGHRLWLAHLGGYDPAQFTELHENLFVVAPDAASAKKRALARVDGWMSPHKDAIMEIETAVDVGAALPAGKSIRLSPDAPERAFRFEARYVPIGRVSTGTRS